MKRVVGLLVVLVALVALSASTGAARTASATVNVYPSGTSFAPSGKAPKGAASSVSLAMPIGGVDDATILVQGAKKVEIDSPTIDSPLQLKLMFAHFVGVGKALVPDALLPWDGSERGTEHSNQPLWLQVTVPQGTAPGTYHGSVQVVADGATKTVPISVTVYDVTLPKLGQVAGSLLTAFDLSAQSYGSMVNKLYGVMPAVSSPELYKFFASYRLSPNNWGYGTPNLPSGYTSSRKWWLNKAPNMEAEVGSPRQFSSMWIPISNNGWPKSGYAGGLSPFAPQKWCSYLKSVRSFWGKQGWLDGSYPYLYGMDEPGAKLYKLVAAQATVGHSCFPGSHTILTNTPSAANKKLWNGGSDDIDDWVVLSSQYYGKFTVPALQKKHISHMLETYKLINKLRKHHKQIWTYTYDSKAHSTPGFTATEPLTNPRMFVDWAALEGITGLLYGQGTTTYSSNPLVSIDRELGSFVLIYPGKDGPIPSARLEEIREGIEDWEILNVVRAKHGSVAVRKLLKGLFSTSAKGTKLGCTVGCQIKTKTPYSWPTYSRDGTTATKLAAMRAAALHAAS